MVEEKVPIKDKFLLTVKEASELFEIGEKKIRWFYGRHLEDSCQYDFFLTNGRKILIKRKKFEEHLENSDSI